ncbi:MAG TPA: hypothetical protein VF219_03125 [Vicinamibacterales bacterium]
MGRPAAAENMNAFDAAGCVKSPRDTICAVTSSPGFGEAPTSVPLECDIASAAHRDADRLIARAQAGRPSGCPTKTPFLKEIVRPNAHERKRGCHFARASSYPIADLTG